MTVMTLEEMKRIKQERGYTMAQLSEYSGVPLGTLQKIFTGETVHPRYATRQALEKALSGEITRTISNEAVTMDGHAPVTYNYGENNKTVQPGYVKEAMPVYSVQKEKKPGEYTVEDYYALPDERRVELIDGVIYDMSAPTFVHQEVLSVIFYQIKAYIQTKGGDCIPMFSPVDVRLDCDDRTMIQPDMIILCDKSKIRRWGIMGAPEFVLEIVSDATRKKDYTKKLQKYSDAGVKEYWIIDPKKKILVTYNFMNEDMPCIHPLEGMAELALYHGDLEIDLSEIADLIQDWPD